jgi:hypothetical protein
VGDGGRQPRTVHVGGVLAEEGGRLLAQIGQQEQARADRTVQRQQRQAGRADVVEVAVVRGRGFGQHAGRLPARRHVGGGVDHVDGVLVQQTLSRQLGAREGAPDLRALARPGHQARVGGADRGQRLLAVAPLDRAESLRQQEGTGPVGPHAQAGVVLVVSSALQLDAGPELLPLGGRAVHGRLQDQVLAAVERDLPPLAAGVLAVAAQAAEAGQVAGGDRRAGRPAHRVPPSTST